MLTYPLVGNFGVPAARPAGSLDPPYESNRIQVQGLVVQHVVEDYSHHTAARSLHEWPLEQGVPAITGVDTRTLTRRLREHGTMQGWLFAADMPVDAAQSQAAAVEMRQEVFRRVSPSRMTTHGNGELTVLLVDAGAKDNLVRSLIERGVRVIRAPWHAELAPLALQSHGVLIGNGPGGPKDLPALVGQVRGLLQPPPIDGTAGPRPASRVRGELPSSTRWSGRDRLT